MDINNLTADERKALMAELAEQDKAEKARVEKERATYRQLVYDTVQEQAAKLREISLAMAAVKTGVFASFETCIALKDDLYKTRLDRQSNSFTSEDGNTTITLGNRIVESYDNTLDVGIHKVKEYLKSLAKDDESAALVEMITKLLTKDRKGNLKANRIVELDQLANKVGDELLLEGIQIIKDSYKPVQSCRFIEVRVKDEQGREYSLPLSMSAADAITDTEQSDEPAKH